MIQLMAQNVMKTLSDRERSFKLSIPAFHLKSGDRKAIVGQTGSGKTTAMDLLALASRPERADTFVISGRDCGQIDVSPQKIKQENARLAHLRARFFGYVVQTSPLFSFLTVRENIAVQQKLADKRDDGYITALLQAVGLAGDSDAFPCDLSIGQRQRTAIARALSHRPAFLMCDEPTGALDDETADLCLRMMTSVADHTGTGILMITHDRQLVEKHGFMKINVERKTIAPGQSFATLQDASMQVRP
ncbi:ABC transporter ATP-binding protein [Bartonella sp. LJL80]